MGQHRKILQIVGYQNSGKTTLMEQLITQAATEGFRVGTIKHHGHGGIPMIESSKDSVRHEKAGASVAAVEGEGTLRMSIHQSNWQLADILAIYETFNMDMILIEGYKNEDYPKVVLLRQAEDESLLQKVSNIICVLYWPTYPLNKPLDYPAYSIQEEAKYMEVLMQEMRRKS
ncbi:molybdopterin-guanine dinucleotide biosynthesis protein B [Lysinibacillus sphaericus]|nr:molybdopterin-guanine dinucleotide biosynthesis protein B [Lysinibacillus sphaericus]MBG9453489.1 molybdopterin-guanine dinucleotide biosynthesis protein B [Lysinibacillus sphaericus]MBG9480369.1 molybdopterin-guanine dinucleotide biosynthesis protein B [Lysinibacillus sphaericus]MBG9595048.1 molybdopterin-guanine dinucleotide biosynthesis protein B [Lysinibacillus sphaericus]